MEKSTIKPSQQPGQLHPTITVKGTTKRAICVLLPRATPSDRSILSLVATVTAVRCSAALPTLGRRRKKKHQGSLFGKATTWGHFGSLTIFGSVSFCMNFVMFFHIGALSNERKPRPLSLKFQLSCDQDTPRRAPTWFRWGGTLHGFCDHPGSSGYGPIEL